jgi:hypothetical protein
MIECKIIMGNDVIIARIAAGTGYASGLVVD